jgi:uncharacterized protein YjiS (DUF1127 family)
MTTKSASVGASPFVPASVGKHSRKPLLDTLREWQRRFRGRRELYGLSQLELRDIGYPATFEAEKVKPFWRS